MKKLSQSSSKVGPSEGLAVAEVTAAIEKPDTDGLDGFDGNKDGETVVETQEFREPIFANALVKSINPYKKFMRIILRFPFNVRKNEVDGSYTFTFTFKSVVTIGFLVTSVIIFLQTLLFVMNVIVVLLHMPPQMDHNYVAHFEDNFYNGKKTYNFTGYEMHAIELYVFHRNLVPVLILLTCLMHSSISNIFLFFRRDFLCRYYSFWTTAVELMRINVGFGEVGKMMTLTIVSYIIFLILLVIFAAVQFAPMTTGAATVFSMLTLRIAIPHILFIKNFWLLRSFQSIFILYIFINSKSTILFFFWTCRLLRKSFQVWNHRLEQVLHRGESTHSRTEKVANRTGYDHLFKDHVCLLDLIGGADTLFSNTVESYYVTTVCSICFEIFFSIRSVAAKDEFPGARSFDGIVMALYLFQTCLILFSVTWSAAMISEEALQGLEVIRRKGMMGRKDDDELYFMISMYVSYSGHFDTALTCGGYFVLNKGFLVGLFGTVVSYFIVVMQFSPPLTMKDESMLSLIKDLGALINITEGANNPYDNGPSFTAFNASISDLMTASGF